MFRNALPLTDNANEFEVRFVCLFVIYNLCFTLKLGGIEISIPVTVFKKYRGIPLRMYANTYICNRWLNIKKYLEEIGRNSYSSETLFAT